MSSTNVIRNERRQRCIYRLSLFGLRMVLTACCRSFLDASLLNSKLYWIWIAFSLIIDMKLTIIGVWISTSFCKAHKVIRRWILLASTNLKVSSVCRPWYLFLAASSTCILTDSCTWPVAKLSTRFTYSEMSSLQIIHSLICCDLINLTLVWHSTLIAIVNILFESLWMNKICFLVLVLYCDTTIFISVVSRFWYMLIKICWGVDSGALSHLEIRFWKAKFLICNQFLIGAWDVTKTTVYCVLISLVQIMWWVFFDSCHNITWWDTSFQLVNLLALFLHFGRSTTLTSRWVALPRDSSVFHGALTNCPTSHSKCLSSFINVKVTNLGWCVDRFYRFWT